MQGRQIQSLYKLQCAYSFEIYIRGLCARSVALSKHVTHYGTQSGFSYYNLIKILKTNPFNKNIEVILGTINKRTDEGVILYVCMFFEKNSMYHNSNQ